MGVCLLAPVIPLFRRKRWEGGRFDFFDLRNQMLSRQTGEGGERRRMSRDEKRAIDRDPDLY